MEPAVDTAATCPQPQPAAAAIAHQNKIFCLTEVCGSAASVESGDLPWCHWCQALQLQRLNVRQRDFFYPTACCLRSSCGNFPSHLQLQPWSQPLYLDTPRPPATRLDLFNQDDA